MIGNSTLLSAALTLVSVLSLSLLALFCLRCRKKSKIIHEELQIYNPQTFQRGGSRFAVMQSKTVTRPSPMPSANIESLDDYEEFPQGPACEQSDYINVTEATTGQDMHTYVAPIAITVYENERAQKKTTGSNQTEDIYVNTEQTNDDDDDYENSLFLKEQADEEPDYVNEDGS